MVIHVIMNYVLGDGTRQTEKNKIVAIKKKELKYVKRNIQ